MIAVAVKAGIHLAVIPAKAGIQFAAHATDGMELGPGLRRGDGCPVRTGHMVYR
jgi:hypothetical protein